MSSLSDGPACSEAVDSTPSSDLLHVLAQRIKALEESSAAQREFGMSQSATIASQAAIIETLKAAVKASEEAVKASEHETKDLKSVVRMIEHENEKLKAAVKKSEQETATLQSDVKTLKEPRAPRNLVICIDGTSNQFGIKNTNVVELYHRLIRDENQLTFYNSGIGTYATPSWKSWRYWRMVIYNKIDLAIAWNFEGIIISAYRWLSENYEPGDKIFVFGFSRGAYQIRALAAMIDSVGLLRKGNLDQIPFAYELYAETKKSNPWIIVRIIRLVFGCLWVVIVILLGWGPLVYPAGIRRTRPDPHSEDTVSNTKKMCKHFKETFSQENVKIEFAGAWDTVSSVGFVRDKTLPNTTDGMAHVKYFRHALALHERRVKFLNENSHGGLGPTAPAAGFRSEGGRINYPHTKEVWFAGSHGDIGGGAINNLEMDTFGPSLRWMLYEAVAAGLRITSAPETEKNLQVHNSFTWPWVILEYLPIPRLSYKNSEGLTLWPHCGQPRQIQPNQLIHSTALKSRTDWRAHLPEGVEWDETSLKGHGMVEEDRYADARDLIARLSHLPPKDGDLAVLGMLFNRDDGKVSLQNTVGAEATLMALLQFHADNIPEHPSDPWMWFHVAAAALIVVDLDTAENNQGEIYSVDQLLALVNQAKLQNDSRLDRLKGLLVPVIIKKLKEIFDSPTDIPDDSAIRALKIVLETDHWERLRDIPEMETVLINVLQRCSLENDPSGEGRQVIADAVLILIQEENRGWNDRYYLTQEHELHPILARARERNEPELLERFERRYAPALVRPPFRHPSHVLCVAWMPDGARIVSGCEDHAVRIWDVETGKIVDAMTGHSDHVTSVSVSRDGSKIASGSIDKTIRVWNAQTRAEICCLEGHMSVVRSVVFSPDGVHIASGSFDKTIRVWDIASGEIVVGPIQGHEETVYSVAYSPDGSRIVSASQDKSIRVWNPTTGEGLWQTKTGDPIFSVAYSPDGKQIVALSVFEELILDAETGAIIRRLKGLSFSVAFSPDGKKIASGARTVQFWDAETGAKLDVLRGHRDHVSSVAFSPNSERIASASYDNTVRIWDATGAWRRAITDAAFERNGNNHAALSDL